MTAVRGTQINKGDIIQLDNKLDIVWMVHKEYRSTRFQVVTVGGEYLRGYDFEVLEIGCEEPSITPPANVGNVKFASYAIETSSGPLSGWTARIITASGNYIGKGATEAEALANAMAEVSTYAPHQRTRPIVPEYQRTIYYNSDFAAFIRRSTVHGSKF